MDYQQELWERSKTIVVDLCREQISLWNLDKALTLSQLRSSSEHILESQNRLTETNSNTPAPFSWFAPHDNNS